MEVLDGDARVFPVGVESTVSFDAWTVFFVDFAVVGDVASSSSSQLKSSSIFAVPALSRHAFLTKEKDTCLEGALCASLPPARLGALGRNSASRKPRSSFQRALHVWLCSTAESYGSNMNVPSVSRVAANAAPSTSSASASSIAAFHSFASRPWSLASISVCTQLVYIS